MQSEIEPARNNIASFSYPPCLQESRQSLLSALDELDGIYAQIIRGGYGDSRGTQGKSGTEESFVRYYLDFEKQMERLGTKFSPLIILDTVGLYAENN